MPATVPWIKSPRAFNIGRNCHTAWNPIQDYYKSSQKLPVVPLHSRSIRRSHSHCNCRLHQLSCKRRANWRFLRCKRTLLLRQRWRQEWRWRRFWREACFFDGLDRLKVRGWYNSHGLIGCVVVLNVLLKVCCSSSWRRGSLWELDWMISQRNFEAIK